MKQLLPFFALLLSFNLSAQTADTVLISYKGGNAKLESDLEMNFGQVFKEYNFNGTVQLYFTLSKDGKISDITLYPESNDRNFSSEIKRAVKRTVKNWVPASINGLKVNSGVILPLTYYVTLQETDGRLRFLNNDPYRSARIFQ